MPGNGYQNVKISGRASYHIGDTTYNVGLDDPLRDLPYAKDAPFNSFAKQHEPTCLPDTRVALLDEIYSWADGPDGRCIFWLYGLAGTGKSTIARTVARRYHDKQRLAASFFFSRGGGDVGHAGKFVTSIAVQLAHSVPAVRQHISDAVTERDNIASKSLRDQWQHLVLRPLSKLSDSDGSASLVLVVDALDECDSNDDIRIIMQLLAEAPSTSIVRLRVLLTSRPEVPIQHGFYNIPELSHQDVVLHNISLSIVDHDIRIFLSHNLGLLARDRGLREWPSRSDIDSLVQIAGGSYVWAATACRSIGEAPLVEKELRTLLQNTSTFNDTASDSAYESGLSDTASVWSVAFSEESQSSNGEFKYVTQSATDKMAEVFWQNSELQSLYSEASSRLSKEIFASTHDELLKSFFSDLRSETANDKQLKTVRILRHRAHRQQVTEWIYRLASPKLDREALEARQVFLNQRENRDELLERFLQSQTKPSKSAEEFEQELAPAGDSSDEEEEDAVSLDELNAITTFLVSGLSFEILKINLHGLAHPETAITEALRSSKVEVLQALLSKQFSRVATGDYDWIKELDAAGYTKAEIAQLLAEEAADSPWIFFTPQATDMGACVVAEPQFHVPGCIHNGSVPHPDRVNPLTLPNIETSHELLQELCGLAGVVPSSRNKQSWNGSVRFGEDSSVAAVTYAILEPGSVNGNQALLARSVCTLEALIGAVGTLQTTNGCCNGYSVIVHDEMPAFISSRASSEIGTVELRRISVDQLLSLLHEAKQLQLFANARPVDRHDVRLLQSAALNALHVLGRYHFPTEERLTYDETLHLVALSAQFVSMAFLSYTQAHVAPVLPFYLDTALSKILLLGTGDPQKPPFHIVAETTGLTCIGDMLQGPVIVFHVEPVRTFAGAAPIGPCANFKYDVIASAEDLIDTWDCGSLIVPAHKPASGCDYYAIQLCGGVITPDKIMQSGRTVSYLFHWSSSANPMTGPTFNTAERIRIGAFVTVNSGCLIDANERWHSSAPAFEVLGVKNDVWRHEESQYGGQGGQYVVLQYNHTKHRVPGTTLKVLMLRDIRNEAYKIRYYLDDLWGAQVSYCTGIARRVPLRVLMADLMSTVAESMPGYRDTWTELNDKHRVIEAFFTDSVTMWFENLDEQQSTFMNQLMREVLLILEPTGVDEDRNELTVAWVFARPPYRCFRVPCNDRKNSWLKVLSESEDCATFAYIVTRCLETPTVGCRGPSPCWNSTAPLLETAIIQHNLKLSQPLGPLEHKRTYFFKKMDSWLQVTAEKERASGIVSLYISPSFIPARFRQRVCNWEKMRNYNSRIRERKESGDMGAETVAIYAKT